MIFVREKMQRIEVFKGEAVRFHPQGVQATRVPE
jgi:hypothetical protein